MTACINTEFADRPCQRALWPTKSRSATPTCRSPALGSWSGASSITVACQCSTITKRPALPGLEKYRLVSGAPRWSHAGGCPGRADRSGVRTHPADPARCCTRARSSCCTRRPIRPARWRRSRSGCRWCRVALTEKPRPLPATPGWSGREAPSTTRRFFWIPPCRKRLERDDDYFPIDLWPTGPGSEIDNLGEALNASTASMTEHPVSPACTGFRRQLAHVSAQLERPVPRSGVNLTRAWKRAISLAVGERPEKIST